MTPFALTPKEIQSLVFGSSKQLDDLDIGKAKEIGKGRSAQEYSFTVYHDQAPLTPNTRLGEDITIVDMYDGRYNVIFYIRTHVSFKDIKNYMDNYEDILIDK